MKTAATLAAGDRLSLQFAEGRAEAEVLGSGTAGGAGAAADRKKRRPENNGGSAPEQETLW